MTFEEIISKLPKPYYLDLEYGQAIYCADCRDILPLLPDRSIDLVLTSPPYDDLRLYDGHGFHFCNIPILIFDIMTEGACCVWVVGDQTINGSETGSSFKQVLCFMDNGFNLHDTMIYHKRGGLMTGSLNCYIQKFEYMFIFTKGKIKTVNIIKDKPIKYTEARTKLHRKRDGTFDIQEWECGGDGRRENIWTYDVGLYKSSRDKFVFEHPAIFPEALANDHIISWSNPDELILDPFLGSGTTAYCAKKLGRKCIGIEIVERYAAIAAKRLSQSVMRLEV